MNKAVTTLGVVVLQVMASQTNDASKYSTTPVVIDVKDKNAFPPTFEKSNYYGMISSDSANGTFVFDSGDPNRPLVVVATDDDYDDKQNPFLAYKIENSTAFRILRDGFIMTNAIISTPGTIVFEVSATDSSTNEKTSTVVSVEVVAATTTVPTTTRAAGTGPTTTTTPGTGSTTTTTRDFTQKSKGYTVNDMAALGATLGAILALSLIALVFLVHKHYGNTIRKKLGSGSGDNSGDSKSNAEQLINETDDPANDLSEYGGFSTKEPASSSVTLETSVAVGSAPLQDALAENQPSETAEQDDDSDDKKVKSILTKELKEDAGYKSVWFREDAAPEVVVIEGVEDGEADDDDDDDDGDDNEDFTNQQQDDNDDYDEEEEDDLVPTFNGVENKSQNSIL